MTPLVSIIINCFNQGHYLERSVKSVLSQTFTDLECLIVDDGSTDNTREIAENLITIDKRVKYFFKENSGLPSSRNFGVQQAQGEWIQCLDSDDWIHEDKIKFQLSHLEQIQNSENIVFYSNYERVFIDAQENIVNTQENIIGLLNKDQLIQRLLIPDFLADSPHPCLQQAMLMNRNILSKTKFPEHLKALGDRYFAVDILKLGANFIYTPMVGAYYTKHKSNRTNNWNYMKNYYTIFYENITQTYPELNQNCQTGIEYLLEEAIREKDQDLFNRLIKIVPTPVYLFDKKIKTTNTASIKILNALRSIIPNFLLYEKYRGPRSKKLISFVSGKIKSVKNILGLPQ
ncbi:glycosyltransferase family 2 protein [Nodularia sphaerocarpa]|uniref:glycosyltransferase family 2 protein n=1 Tax=Nodularia sphaerocarpa TaxID=137816 RepID=UPI001EFB4564|nr:glycosyltransferase family 2 protein [Nodularia sphaerocarpa]MDB9372413.1 glycosyltransferase family 2 protein [Nodularia sphaerocarpa CS-585]MDB9379126.1 glycosyltransferase family 2 protein [Nodularia sphaerocarpa CS-585A2]ULP71021.1 putative glycosyltransferase EpsJ [Nodularia sphaerocarpa UHCC 0038]